MNNLGEKIKVLRKSANLTQTELSGPLLNRSTISKIENGLLMPSLIQLEYICSQLNVNMNDLTNNNFNVLNNDFKSYNTSKLHDMYVNKKYLDIIEDIHPYDFKTYYYVGMSYFHIDLPREAKDILEKCEELFNKMNERDKIENVEMLCYTLNTLRVLSVPSFNDAESLGYLKSALNYLKMYGNSRCEIYYILNNNITSFYIYNKKYYEAIGFVEPFLNINRTFTPINLLPFFHYNLCVAYFSTRNYREAIKTISKAILLFDYLEDTAQASESYLYLFYCYLFDNQYSNCHKLLDTVFDKFKSHQILQVYKICELVLLYNENNIPELIKKIKDIRVQQLRHDSLMDYYFILARTNFITKNYSAVQGYYKKCQRYLIKNNKYRDLALMNSDLYEITNDESYNDNYILFSKKDNDEKYNPRIPDVTSPNYKF